MLIQKNGYCLEEVTKIIQGFKIFIEADSNDGDYISESTFCSVKFFENEVLPQLKILKTFCSGHHEFGKFYSEFINVPTCDWGSCHSLEELSISYTDNTGKFYNVVVDKFTQDEIDEINEKFGDWKNYLKYLNYEKEY